MPFLPCGIRLFLIFIISEKMFEKGIKTRSNWIAQLIMNTIEHEIGFAEWRFFENIKIVLKINNILVEFLYFCVI